jgi:hypothetical protein
MASKKIALVWDRFPGTIRIVVSSGRLTDGVGLRVDASGQGG